MNNQDKLNQGREQLALADRLFDYFAAKYGPERARIICKKVTIELGVTSYDEAVRIGEKWHLFNNIMHGRE